MKITDSKYIKSSVKTDQYPEMNIPEYAFIGRSNVGKSSLINMLLNKKELAKISAKPGKTRTINHYLINGRFYIADLPGYGYAKLSKSERKKMLSMIEDYIFSRKNLIALMVLVDSRHEPQKQDTEFITYLGENRIPFSIVFTKSDKLSNNKLEKNINAYKKFLLKDWESLPDIFITSAKKKNGRDEILYYIDKHNKTFVF